ncbi:MAG: sulfotransferase [Caldilineaceae bacterium]|nr:sulfotransferase [Caldilineaceae bacterium]
MKPNFLIIGAAKAGTTSLYDYLSQHPDVYMCPLKEPKFFSLEGHKLDFAGPGDRRANRRTVTDWDTYQGLFEHSPMKRATGEKSPIYLYDKATPQRIKRYVPDAKIVVVLRNPVARAYSNYVHMVRDSREPLTDFTDALAAEPARIRANWAYGWHYKQMGFYAEQLQRYYDLFDDSQIRVFLYDDLRTQPAAMIRSLFEFIEVDPSFEPDMSFRENKTGIPRSARLQLFLKYKHPLKSIIKPFIPSSWRRSLRVAVTNRNLTPAQKLTETARQQLLADYAEDITNLQDLIKRDLSAWLQ